MVLTIEPGIYVRAADDVPKAFRNIGIRIEDDALVTGNGCELLTSDVPKAAKEIEALMAEAGSAANRLKVMDKARGRDPGRTRQKPPA
jgi:Xaa-Pro aminopeptidase